MEVTVDCQLQSECLAKRDAFCGLVPARKRGHLFKSRDSLTSVDLFFTLWGYVPQRA